MMKVNFIFNDGTKQSADLWTDEDVCYGWENDKAVLIGCIETDIEDVESTKGNAKFVYNGQLLIRHNGKLYNIMGQEVK